SEITQRTYNDTEWHITDFEGNPFPDENLPFSLVMTTGLTVYDVRHAIEWSDGSRILLSINGAPLYDNNGQIDAMVAELEDVTERFYALEALRASEEKYRNLVDYSLQGIIIFQDGHFVFANSVASTIFGYSIDETLSMSPEAVIGLVHPEDQERIAANIQQQLAGLPVEPRHEFRVVRSDGQIKTVEIFTSLTTFRDKPAVQGAMIDITERKQIEESLLASEAQYHYLVDNSVQGIVILQEGHFVFANAAMSRIVGYSTEEMLAMSAEQVFNLVHPDDQEMVSSNVQKRLAGLSFKPYYEHRLLGANGQIRTVELYASLTTYQGKAAVLGTYIDITERRQAEEALRVSEERLRLITDNLRDLVLQVDENGIIRYASPSAQDVLEVAPEAMLGTHISAWTEHIHPDDRELIVKIMSERLTTGLGPNLLSYRYRHSSGETRWKELVVSPYNRENGSLAGFIYGVRDITERKLVEAAQHDSEERYRAVVNTVPYAIAIVEDGKYSFVNPAGIHMLGYTSIDNILGMPALDIVMPKYHPVVAERLNRLATGDVNPLLEFEALRSDGTAIWLESRSAPVNIGGHPAALIIAMDITERKQSQQALQASELRFRSYFELGLIGVGIQSLDMRWLEVNNKVC
ncbi:MAG TPA: PAS domain S-box protein, partial [Phototrophicaceae bacterium]|nr:PAS domain S-box protein [Phototrophicaceae bacterium]